MLSLLQTAGELTYVTRFAAVDGEEITVVDEMRHLPTTALPAHEAVGLLSNVSFVLHFNVEQARISFFVDVSQMSLRCQCVAATRSEGCVGDGRNWWKQPVAW